MLGYASYFVAFLLTNLKGKEKICRVVLYGSHAMGTANKESDIDIFIETKEKKLEKSIKGIEQEFYKSREAMIFKSKGINNRISIKTGTLETWQELYKSIASTGITLYGPYEATHLPSGVNHMVIFFWEKVGKNRGAFLNKLYGVKINSKKYSGLLQKINGKKIGKSSIMIPIEYKNDMFKMIKQHQVQARHIEVFK